MTYLKKINDSWQPIEFPNVQVGEIIEFNAPYENLVRSGQALLVDKDGNELELPGQMFECPVCFKKVEGLANFTDHVSQHMPKKKEEPVKPKEPKKTTEPKETLEDVKADEIRAKRLAALEKARATRATNLKNKK